MKMSPRVREILYWIGGTLFVLCVILNATAFFAGNQQMAFIGEAFFWLGIIFSLPYMVKQFREFKRIREKR